LSLHLEHLNPEQLAAVTLPDEHALILAEVGETIPPVQRVRATRRFG
jgi:hypothetical protein